MLDELTTEQLLDLRHCVTYYMNRHVSINSPRYGEYEVILQLLTESIKSIK